MQTVQKWDNLISQESVNDSGANKGSTGLNGKYIDEIWE